MFEPVKIDTLVMGHLCPHMHCHVYPQYIHDDPHALINVQDGAMRLSPDLQSQRIDELRRPLVCGDTLVGLAARCGKASGSTRRGPNTRRRSRVERGAGWRRRP